MANKFLSLRTKTKLYKTLLIPVLLYGVEVCPVRTSDESALGVSERKVFRKIYGSLFIDNGEYQRRWWDELYDMFILMQLSLDDAVLVKEKFLALKVFFAVTVGGSRGGRTLHSVGSIRRRVTSLHLVLPIRKILLAFHEGYKNRFDSTELRIQISVSLPF